MLRRLLKNRTLILILVILPVLQCALLNTFYNGKNSYKVTLKSHKKLMKENPDSVITLPADIEKGYDRAIDKGNKVLKVYPQKVRWHDNSIFLKAKAQMMKGEYTFAVTNLKELQNRFPESPFIPESWLLLGKAYLYKENYNKSEEALRYVLDNYPKLDKKGEVTLLLVSVSVNREGRSKAIQKLEEALKTLKSDDQILEVIIQLSDLYLELNLYNAAIRTLMKTPRLRDYPYKVYRADLNLVKAYRLNGDIDKAISTVSKMLKNARYNKYRPVILLEKGYAYRDKGELEDAENVFEDIVPLEGYNNIRGIAAFELGKIKQYRDGDFEAAKTRYEEAVSLISDKVIKEEVQKILDGLLDRETYLAILNEVEESDTVDQDSAVVDTNFYLTKYKLGEVYWLNLGEPDSALNTFEELCADSAADSVLVMKAFYGLAWISLNMKSDTARADSLFSMIIERYPATVAAKKAQAALGMEVTIATRRDSALMAYADAEMMWMEKGQEIKAVNNFYKLSKNYPDFEDIASLALYSAGWVCDNVLHKNKNALKFYRKLCKEYPESGLCIDEAAPRIKIVDDTLAVLKLQNSGEDQDLFKEIEKQKENTDTTTVKDSTTIDKHGGDSTQTDSLKTKNEKRSRRTMSGPSAAFSGPMGPTGSGRPPEKSSVDSTDVKNDNVDTADTTESKDADSSTLNNTDPKVSTPLVKDPDMETQKVDVPAVK